MRLFIAINFDNGILDAIGDLQAELKNCGVDGHFTKRENLHLTLAFIGEYPDPDDVLDVIRSIPFEPVTLQFDGLQHFRDMYFARFQDNPELNRYVSRLRRALADAGIPFDRKKFMPHITLIRKAFIRGNRPAELPESLSCDTITVEHASLMRSDRGKQGMIYTEIY